MDVVSFTAAADFQAAAYPFLEEREAEHNVLLGVTSRIVSGGTGGPRSRGEQPGFWLVEDSGRDVGAALVTPPYDLQLGLCAPGAASAIAERVAAEGWTLPGASGPRDAADEFARRWESLTASRASLWRPERLYTLTRVVPQEGVPGSMRPAGTDDIPLLTEWIDAFGRHFDEEIDAPVTAREGVEAGRFVLWIDSQPVSLAGWARWTRTGVAVAPVYTPPEQRGKGYASALTAALSRKLLEEGRSFCCLYTDARDPVANRVYARVGYRPVLDVAHYRFSPSTSPPE
jgi:GNAT superfamily N-acetyltransferase